MEDIGIFFGSNTGNTKKIAYLILNCIKKYFNVCILDISKSSLEEFNKYNIFILGTSTWYYGELQYDWDNFLPLFKKIDFSNKIIAFFGCGNQIDYSDYFCDGVSVLYNIVIDNNAKVIGYWSIKNYKFNYSKSLLNKDYFIGLFLDEDNQSKLTLSRINKWTKKLIKEINEINVKKKK